MDKNKTTDPATGEEVEVIDIELYALNIDADGRILSATEDQYGAPGQPRVETLPTGESEEEKDISNWIYKDGQCVFSPLPKPPEPEPEPQPQPSGGDVTYSELATAIREGVNSYGQ